MDMEDFNFFNNNEAPPPPLAANLDGMNINANADDLVVAAADDDGILDGNGNNGITFRSRQHPSLHVENNLNEVVNDNNHMNIDDNEDIDNEEDNDAEDAEDGIQDGDDGNDIVHYHYSVHNEEQAVPFNVTMVTVDPYFQEIVNNTFENYELLTTVNLPEGLECIGDNAFQFCTQLSRINIPSTVKMIGYCAFINCESLESVELPEGLEHLGDGAFAGCLSLQSIILPPKFKAIGFSTFWRCAALSNVELQEGLKSIGDDAFDQCPSLRHIKIPPTVRDISLYTFRTSIDPNGDIRVRGLSHLDEVKFCDDMEEFLSALSIRDDRWKHGTSRRSLQIYNFVDSCHIHPRLLTLDVVQWQVDIIQMLWSIPDDFEALDDHFDTIHATLVVYEFKAATSLLELVIWKSKIFAQHGPNISNVGGIERSQCRDNCGASVIIPNVLPFMSMSNQLPTLLKDIN